MQKTWIDYRQRAARRALFWGVLDLFGFACAIVCLIAGMISKDFQTTAIGGTLLFMITSDHRRDEIIRAVRQRDFDSEWKTGLPVNHPFLVGTAAENIRAHSLVRMNKEGKLEMVDGL